MIYEPDQPCNFVVQRAVPGFAKQLVSNPCRVFPMGSF